MLERFPTVVIAIVALWVVLLLWAATILFVFWHSGRQKLVGSRRVAWILLSLIPFAGFLAYLWTRPSAAVGNGGKRRVTMVKPPAGGRPSPAGADHLQDLSGPPGGVAGRQLPTIALAGPAREEALRDPPTFAPRPAAGPGPVIPPALPSLRVVDGPHAGEHFRLDTLPGVIGRGAGSTVFLENDMGVSRRHAELYHKGHTLWLRDLNSRHGTWLNGQPITESALTAGDTVQVGVSRLLLQYEESG
jgi:hypothetical protein